MILFLVIPLRGTSIDNHPNARWKQNGLTVADRSEDDNKLAVPCGLYVDDDQTVYVAGLFNYRIMEWKPGATNGQVVASGNGQGSGPHQLFQTCDGIVDKERDSHILCDYSNARVVRWPVRNGTSGETIISDVNCIGLTMDENGSLYVVDNVKDELSHPRGAVVDQLGTVDVTDGGNARIMRWPKGATQGSVIAGGNGEGEQSNQINWSAGWSFDRHGNLYVADNRHHRV
ncbi:unnamed protein product [Rotaria socialis]